MKSLKMLAYGTLLAASTGCGSMAMAPEAPMSPGAVDASGVLDRSLFSRDGSGAVSEDDLQTILKTPIDLAFPARVGVVPLGAPFEPGEEVTVGLRSTASEDFAERLRGSEYFTHVSDISTDLPNVGGIEGLRAIAARYRLRYLILYSEQFVDETHANGWAALYPTLIGIFLSPGVTVESRGLAQADLIDVRTGTVLFSTVVPMHVESVELPVNASRAQAEGELVAAQEAAGKLARKVTGQVSSLIAYADQHAIAKDDGRRPRILPAPIESIDAPERTAVMPAPDPSVATHATP